MELNNIMNKIGLAENGEEAATGLPRRLTVLVVDECTVEVSQYEQKNEVATLYLQSTRCGPNSRGKDISLGHISVSIESEYEVSPKL